MPGVLLSRYVDDLDMYEAQRMLMMAQAASMQYAKRDLWDRLIDRAMPRPEMAETFFRYEGQPVRTAELKAALSKRWGTGFQAD